MKEIPLTQGKTAIVDDEDFEELSKFRWCFHHSGYAVRNQRNRSVNGCKTIQMHNEIMQPPSGFCVDHINRNSLDNRRQNLRVASFSQNSANQKLSSRNTTGYKGVKRASRGWDRWQATVRHQRKDIHLGYFRDIISAAKAYDAGAREIFGEFASLNFPSAEIEAAG